MLWNQTKKKYKKKFNQPEVIVHIMYGEDSVDEDEPVPDVTIPDNMLGEDSVDEDELESDVVTTDIMVGEDSIDENDSPVFNDPDELDADF
jgi:hypothetical protein